MRGRRAMSIARKYDAAELPDGCRMARLDEIADARGTVINDAIALPIFLPQLSAAQG